MRAEPRCIQRLARGLGSVRLCHRGKARALSASLLGELDDGGDIVVVHEGRRMRWNCWSPSAARCWRSMRIKGAVR
jgi:hypothetical protein